eukprot:TRINITY_DN67863_c8_g3_i1.p2 TRINITY_DN67863_c8_g3~~TRINITY_DN67863_c8_g3_i1.p2  ORF type:complete len:119 (-),score=6.82 TRINITY_DN67863_c8_g3_i1:512-868(-)
MNGGVVIVQWRIRLSPRESTVAGMHSGFIRSAPCFNNSITTGNEWKWVVWCSNAKEFWVVVQCGVGTIKTLISAVVFLVSRDTIQPELEQGVKAPIPFPLTQVVTHFMLQHESWHTFA